MFEKFIESLLLQHFGDYIENLDANKLQVGLLSGSLLLEDIIVKPKKINELKLPFKLSYGICGKLLVQLPWKSNFSSPTIIQIENVEICLQLVSKDQWEFIDNISYEAKLGYLNSFFNKKVKELNEALSVNDTKNAKYLDRVKLKIIDNLHINFKNIHIRIENCDTNPYSSMGFTLDELLILNTNDHWEETFINRTMACSDLNVFKLLKITNFGFYMNTNENIIVSWLSDQKEKRKAMLNLIKKTTTTPSTKEAEVTSESTGDSIGNIIDYLIRPISLTVKMKQYNNQMSIPVNIDLYSESSKNTSDDSGKEKEPQTQIWITLEQFDIDFRKKQYDTIVNLINHISQYQRYQYFKYESRRYLFYKPSSDIPIKGNEMIWWRYAIRTIIKRRHYLHGNTHEFSINPFLQSHYKTSFKTLFTAYVNNGKLKEELLIKSKQLPLFKRIITLTDIALLYEWSIDNIQEYFKQNKTEEMKQKSKGGLLSFIYSSTSNTDLRLTPEEESKIEEIMSNLKKEIKNEQIYTGKEIKLQIEFNLNSGSFVFSNKTQGQDDNSIESFGFLYRHLSFSIRKSEMFTDIDTALLDFNLYMETMYKGKTRKKILITRKDEAYNKKLFDQGISPEENLRIGNYIWKLKLRLNSPNDEINSSLYLHVNTINIVYNQTFLERVISFFVIKPTFDKAFANKAWEKLYEIKEKTSKTIKAVITKKNIIHVDIDSRKILIPLNKYDMKNSKILLIEQGKFTINNTSSIDYYKERYLASFTSLNIVYLNSLEDLSNIQKEHFHVIKDMKFNATIGILSNKTMSERESIINVSIDMENINVNMTERVYYSLHFFLEVMKPTKQYDYWAILEQNSIDIKKNCKVFSKITKKDNLIIASQYEECFAVLSGGYIYFYNQIQDDDYESYLYVKNAFVREIESNVDKKIFVLSLKNKYGDINLKLSSRKKYLQFFQGLNETINEMNAENDIPSIQPSIPSTTTNNDDLLSKSPKKTYTLSVNPLEKIMSISLNIKEISCNLLNESQDNTPMFKLLCFNTKLSNHIRPYDKTMTFSIGCISLYDESEKGNDRLYEIITSSSQSNTNNNSVNITIIITDPCSSLYNNADIDINIEIGYLFSIWNPYAIRRLLFFLAHNEILRNMIKDEILNIPSQIKLNAQKESENETQIAKMLLQDDLFIKPTCGPNPGKYWVTISANLTKVTMIWVQPVSLFYFIRLELDKSKLSVQMTVDDFHIEGVLGSLTMHDMTNYPYAQSSNPIQLNNKDETYSKIISFNSISSLSFDFYSYGLNCPLLKDNVTSTAHVVFNSVKLNYIHEYFFRAFNYIFDEFLGAMQPPPIIKEYRNTMMKIPIKKTLKEFEFMKVKVEFKNPQIILKAREKYQKYFLADLGIVTITNTYEKCEGRIRLEPTEERYVIKYHFDLKQLYLQLAEEYKIIENINASLDLVLPLFLNGEENMLNDSEIDKSFCIDLRIDTDAKVNLYQKDFRYLMQCSDLNLTYVDGQSHMYDYKAFFRRKYDVPCNESGGYTIKINANEEENEDDGMMISKVQAYPIITFNMSIPSISISFFENRSNTVFSQLNINQMQLAFLKRISGLNELDLTIQNTVGYNYISTGQKELMLSTSTSSSSFKDISSASNGLLSIKLVLDKTGEKNLIIKISKIKVLLRLDIVNLFKLFFLEGLPQYEPNSLDLPNQFNPDTDTRPKLRLNMEIQHILICLPTEVFTSSHQDVICLSTDLSFLFKKEKIIQCKHELSNNYTLFIEKMKEAKSHEEKQSYEREIAQDFTDISTLNISFNNISPFISHMKDIFNDENQLVETRKLMKTFKFIYGRNGQLRYSHKNMYVASTVSTITTDEIVCKISYSDLVLFLKVIEYNFKRMDVDYDEVCKSFMLNATSTTNSSKEIEGKMSKEFIDEDDDGSEGNTIDKGMGVDKIACSSIQIILIDNHSTTYYPFLSLICQDVVLLNEKLSINQSVFRGSASTKIIMYNYYVGVWEPLLERTNFEFERLTDNSDQSISKNIWYFEIKNRNESKIPSNINISDMTITFLYSTLKLWLDKYFNLQSNYTEEAKRILQDKPKSVSNHTVVNLSGRPMKIYWINHKERNDRRTSGPTYHHAFIAEIDPNKSYDIEYIEDNDLSISKLSTASASASGALMGMGKERHIAFAFDGIGLNQISHNYIKIDEIQLKEHAVNYNDVIMKYATAPELKYWQHLISEVKIIDLKKRITIHSPLIIVNKMNKDIKVHLMKNGYSTRDMIASGQQFAIPYEYMDGNIEFCLKEDNDEESHNDINSRRIPQIFDVRTFLDNSFTKTEMRFDKCFISLFRAVRQINQMTYIRIILSPPYTIRNCLPFAIQLTVKDKTISIDKSSKELYYSLSSYDNFLCRQFKCINFSNKQNCPIELYNCSYSNRKNSSFHMSNTVNGTSSSKPISSSANPSNSPNLRKSLPIKKQLPLIFYLFNHTGAAIQLLASIIPSSTNASIVIVIHTSGIIYNSTLMPLTLYYFVDGEKYEIPGQTPEGNVIMISDQKKMIVELTQNNLTYTSVPVSLNAIGLITNIECSQQVKRKCSSFSYLYEFTLEATISLIADDLDIFTMILTIHPKYIICNKTNDPMYISNTNMTLEPEIVHSEHSKPFFFSYKEKMDSGTISSNANSRSNSHHSSTVSNDTILMIRPIEDAEHYKSGSKWNWSYPINFEQTGLITSQIMSIKDIYLKKYINIERKVQDYSTFILLTNTSFSNAQFVIENYSYYISIRISQVDYGTSAEYVPLRSKAIFAWANAYHPSKKIKVEFLYTNNHLCSDKSSRQYSLNTLHFPYIEEIHVQKNQYTGHKFKLEITTNGIKVIFRILDYVLQIKSEEDIRLASFPNSKSIFPSEGHNGKKETICVNEINLKIEQIGLSLISDNRNLKSNTKSYNRNELCYATFKGIQLFHRVETAAIARCSNREYQCKINSIQIDNEYSHITLYPILLRPESVEEFDRNGKEMPPFFNIAMSCYRLSDDEIEPTKFNYFNFLIQSFNIAVDNEILEAVIDFSRNINGQLKTTFTQVHPLLYNDGDDDDNEMYFRPEWVDSNSIISDNSKIFFEVLETSSIQMITSFKASEVIEKYITKNPILGTLLSAVTNMEKADIRLNGSEMRNLYYSPKNLVNVVLNQYKQSLLTQILSIFGAIDLLGNPSNLLKSLGTGVRDFFIKPIEGIVKGPLEGVEGAIEGGYSLLKNTIGGACSATSKIATGISKGLLHLSRDEKYLKKIEKEKVVLRPKNFVDGFGYGITSFANGVFSGLCDVIVKPIEETQKNGISGIGSGIVKGIGGFFSKPVVGVLQLVSNTTEGIKNTLTSEEIIQQQIRIPRPFYGKYKYIETYNSFHANVLQFLQMHIEEIRSNRQFCFYDAEYYENRRNEPFYLIFDLKELYIIDKNKKETKIVFPYLIIKEVIIDKNSMEVKMIFNQRLNGKDNAVLYLLQGSINGDIIVNKIQKAIKDAIGTLK